MNRVEDLSESEWDFNFAVNAKGVFLSDQAALRLFKQAQTRGVIVNTASMAGKVGAPLLAHYAASKFAVVGFTQSLALEVAPLGIRVNCVCPGFVRTGMQDREVQWEARLTNKSADEVVQKMLRCGDPANGHAVYLCPDSQERRVVAFSCKSQFCLSCAKVYGQTWVATYKGCCIPVWPTGI